VERRSLQRVINSLVSKKVTDMEDPSFYLESELNLFDVQISVDGIGNLSFPLTVDTIHKLIAISSKAKFGSSNEVFSIAGVQNVSEILMDKVRVTIWPSTLDLLTARVRANFGLPEGTALVLHLDKMLICEPGQFYAKDKDHEILDGTVATLVIALPSPYIGGDLGIEYNARQHIFSSQNLDRLRPECIVFDVDCGREMSEVTRGYQVVLTYSLVLASKCNVEHDFSNTCNLKPVLERNFRINCANENQLKLVFFGS